jgi:hypothetical protein
VSEETDKDWAAFGVTMVARIESDGPHTGGQVVGSPTHEKAITDVLNAIDGVHEVRIANGADGFSDIEGKATRVGPSERGQRTSFNGAIHVTYDPLQTTEKKIEESIRASGNSVTSAATDSETPGLVTGSVTPTPPSNA